MVLKKRPRFGRASPRFAAPHQAALEAFGSAKCPCVGFADVNGVTMALVGESYVAYPGGGRTSDVNEITRQTKDASGESAEEGRASSAFLLCQFATLHGVIVCRVCAIICQ